MKENGPLMLEELENQLIRKKAESWDLRNKIATLEKKDAEVFSEIFSLTQTIQAEKNKETENKDADI